MSHCLTEVLCATVGGLAVPAAVMGSMAVAHAAPATWGQEVKTCNASACYPDGTARGAYVRDQAGDDSGRGYSQEIHDLADPGRALPSPF